MSRYQLSSGDRGFSLMEDGPLDMRMDRSQEFTAADLVNSLPEEALANLLYELGEERRSRRISRAIVRARPILTTGRLAAVVEGAAPRTGRIHPATTKHVVKPTEEEILGNPASRSAKLRALEQL